MKFSVVFDKKAAKELTELQKISEQEFSEIIAVFELRKRVSSYCEEMSMTNWRKGW